VRKNPRTDTAAATGPQLVTLEVTSETPFGDALVFTVSVKGEEVTVDHKVDIYRW
jgi:hypothetical protein